MEMEEKALVMPVATSGYDLMNERLGPEGRSARSVKAAETRYGGVGFGAGMAKELGPEGRSARTAAAAETLGPEGCSARTAAAWKKRGKPVVAAHTPRQGGGCAKCGATKTVGRGLCNRCYKREWRKTK
ncbi:hypothetical protein CHLRE_12g501700v5 [Chlamydomonas reinhardtii]|uniref:Uncharacterized protein n=1 Tax=Chlamydomonas reinhardtii TaxID=3055 RepID=A8IJB7_CHLRE|nr:uncharacterized protein CHLRE_12g501700v5 [Chlamydomonas reinhardtii]PNW74981.1 hypothetical protein CHLRE_12g501700v5 [Chlamydomonas reinhardtii]|eukprot:XP_001690970.1 predicted protein [Chlamydomonas reinhardtii]